MFDTEVNVVSIIAAPDEQPDLRNLRINITWCIIFLSVHFTLLLCGDEF